MLPEQAIEISKVRFDHAKECLRDAKLLLAGESYRSAANRAYYAIFHAMRAVLAFSARIESVFLVYGSSTVDLLPMLYSSSSSDHEEIM